MPRPPRAVVGAALLACLLLLSGCSSLSGTGDKGYITEDGQLSLVPPGERGDPIELTGEDLEGEPLDLADLRGKVAVVNVWGSWCPPCRAEMPDLVAAAEETTEIASFAGIDIRDPSVEQGRAFVRKFDVPYPSFYSPDGKALLAFSGTLGPRSIPSTVVLDAEGRVAAAIIGPLPSKGTLTTVIEDVAAEDGSGGAGDG